jgi:acetylornithine deacetylase
MISLERVYQVLRDLVAIESVNPSLVPGGAGEERIARYVRGFLESAGCEAKLQEVAPGRYNAAGILRGEGGGRSLILNGHLDTVGVAGMVEPFAARAEAGRLFGRGAQDMKGGLAAGLVAIEALANRSRLKGDVVLHAVADEEYQSAGTRALIAAGAKADAAIVMEPTGLEIATAHKGFAWAEVETQGRAAHGSRPEEGIDAIVLMGRVLAEMESLQRRLESGAAHPLVGRGSVHASLIWGGQELSSYPARCRLSLERRLVPGEDDATFASELDEILVALHKQDPRFQGRFTCYYWAQPLETPRSAAIVELLRQSFRRVSGREAVLGTQTFWTDGALLSAAGIPSVLFGPGGAGLHSSEEYVILEDARVCAEVLADCARTFCGEAGGA